MMLREFSQFAGGNRLDQLDAMSSDRLVDGNVLIGDLNGAAIGGGNAVLARTVAQRRHHPPDLAERHHLMRIGGIVRRPRPAFEQQAMHAAPGLDRRIRDAVDG